MAKDELGHGSEKGAHTGKINSLPAFPRAHTGTDIPRQLVTPDKLNEFVGKVNAMRTSYYEKQMPDLPAVHRGEIVPENVSGKYARLVQQGPGQRSAYAFVNMETGSIHKAAGWKGPEKKHERGNVHDAFGGMKMLGPYGPQYLK